MKPTTPCFEVVYGIVSQWYAYNPATEAVFTM